MRKSSKYKIFSVLGPTIKKVPLRILKFRRPKWMVLQKSLTRKFIRQKNLINLFSIKNTFKSWEKTKKYYKKGFQNKNLLYCLYDKSVKFKVLKKRSSGKTSKKDLILNYLVKPQYKIDILLWNLYFFSSVYQARQEINNKQILVNNLVVKPNFILKRGDVITFKRSINLNENFFTNCFKKYSLNEKFLSFVEIDYYTKTIIILKNFDELSFQDFQLFLIDFVHLKSLSYNIK